MIQRRFGENTSTRAVKQVYAVTYADHTGQGTERESYGEAERIALTLAEEKVFALIVRTRQTGSGQEPDNVSGLSALFRGLPRNTWPSVQAAQQRLAFGLFGLPRTLPGGDVEPPSDRFLSARTKRDGIQGVQFQHRRP